MGSFLGTHTAKLDAKGRTSVPSAFRAALRNGEDAGSIVLRPSHKHPCIEAWPTPLFDVLVGKTNGLDLFSDEHDDMTHMIFGDAFPTEPDKDGRIIVPDILATHAGLTDTVVFTGKGNTFEMWEPAAAARRAAEARERARSRGLTLPGFTLSGLSRGTGGDAGA